MKAVTLPMFALALTVAANAPSTAQTPASSKPKTPVMFPVGAKYAIVDMHAVASTSEIGREALKRLNDLRSKKDAGALEQQDKKKQLQALQTKRDTGGSWLSDAARAQLDKDIEKLRRDIQRASSNELAEMVMAEFTNRVEAVVSDIARERGLHVVFTADAGVLYVAPEIDISDEVIKRLDAKQN